MSARTGGWLTSGSIQSSLLKALAVTIGGALLMAATLLVVMEVLTHRRAAETNLRALASVIALYSEAALEFEDHAADGSVEGKRADIFTDVAGEVPAHLQTVHGLGRHQPGHFAWGQHLSLRA